MNLSSRTLGTLAAALVLSAAASVCGAADDKSIYVEPVQAFPALAGWVSHHVAPTNYVAPPSIQSITIGASVGAASAPFEPAPVILGQPDVPLTGSEAARTNWDEQLNYQGMQVSLMVLGAGGQVQLRPLAAPLRPGERFKIRITPTFSALASVEKVVGDPWHGRRAGQFYPREGMSVQMHAGETVMLPLEPEQFFVFDQWRNERLLLGVRHARAQGEARSAQPAYRQDAAGASSFLQLVPEGRFPAIEQLIAVAQ